MEKETTQFNINNNVKSNKSSVRNRTKITLSKGVNSNWEVGGNEFSSTINGQIETKSDGNIKCYLCNCS